jgi:transcription antitermination factor NusG
MSKVKTISERYPIGTKLKFHSGNFMGLSAVVKKVNENVKDAIFGFLIEVELSNGKTGFVEKSEHFKIVKK